MICGEAWEAGRPQPGQAFRSSARPWASEPIDYGDIRARLNIDPVRESVDSATAAMLAAAMPKAESAE